MRWLRSVNVEWVDVVFVVLALTLFLVLTMEIWLPHRW